MKENCTQFIFLFFNCNRWPASKSWYCCLIKIRYSLSIKICSRQCSDADGDLHVPNHHSIDYHQTLGGHTEILGLGRRQLLEKINIRLALLYSAVPLNCKMEEIRFSNWRLYALLHWKLPENSSISSQNAPQTLYLRVYCKYVFINICICVCINVYPLFMYNFFTMGCI